MPFSERSSPCVRVDVEAQPESSTIWKGTQTMGVVPPVGETQCVLRWLVSGDSEEQVCTLGVKDNLSTDPELTAAAIYTAATATGSLTPTAAMNQAWTFVGVTCYLQDDPGQQIGVFNNPVTATTGGLVTLPTNCAYLVHKNTAQSGRSGKGRMYLPAWVLGEGDIGINGIIESSYTTIQNRLDTFYDALGDESLDVKLFHSAPVNSTPVLSFTLDTQIATQRRRMRN